MIRTLLAALFLSLAIILVLPWFMLGTLLTGNADLMCGTAMKVIRLAASLAGIRVQIEGAENIPARACIFVANHASNIDPLILPPAIPQRVGILVKKELFRIPIFSTAMRSAKYIPVDRGDREEAGASIPIAVRNLQDGLSYIIFAEGTRSPDGRLRRFKKGAFTIAIEAGVPIVPVSIAGTQNLLRKGEKVVRTGEAIIRFGPAVDASRCTVERRTELLARVESAVAAGLPPDQKPLPRPFAAAAEPSDD
jgi:1-acyl-sn-glycerol-3-phosphate acyltransferase